MNFPLLGVTVLSDGDDVSFNLGDSPTVRSLLLKASISFDSSHKVTNLEIPPWKKFVHRHHFFQPLVSNGFPQRMNKVNDWEVTFVDIHIVQELQLKPNEVVWSTFCLVGRDKKLEFIEKFAFEGRNFVRDEWNVETRTVLRSWNC